LPIALVLDAHANLQPGFHFLNLNLEAWQELFAFPHDVVTHSGAQFKDLGLWGIAIDMEDYNMGLHPK
jgi:hypothetical protein